MTKRWIQLFLAVLMAGGWLCACTDASNGTQATTEEFTTAARIVRQMRLHERDVARAPNSM